MRHLAAPLVLFAAPICGQQFEARTSGDAIHVHHRGVEAPVLTHVSKSDQRPYIHPILAPDGKGVLTELRPRHHRHQTGLYWGFTRLNGRDYFHNTGATHWRERQTRVVHARGDKVTWQSEYDLLGEDGEAILVETQRWTLAEVEGRFELDLVWSGKARTNVTLAKYDYGGLFLRMPWKPGIEGAGRRTLLRQVERRRPKASALRGSMSA